MKESDLLNSLYTGIVVKVRFNRQEETLWTYKTFFTDLVVGDLVIIQTPQKTFKIVEVIEIHDETILEEEINYKWIIDKIDFQQYEKALEKEAELLAKIRKLKRDSARKQLVEALGISQEDVNLLTK